MPSTPSSSRPSSIRTPSTQTQPTPLSPPARLHLRNILPPSPEQPSFMPPPPSTPRAWIWQCHLCQTIYRLGCTRRCLDCDHTYCITASPQINSSRSRKRRRDSGSCAAMFDYTGWEQWGSWRRKVLGLEGMRDKKKTHDCWVDCDSPSQCLQRRYELLLVEARREAHVPVRLRQGKDEMDRSTSCADDESHRKSLPSQSGRKGCREAWWTVSPGPKGMSAGEGEEEGDTEDLYDVEEEEDEDQDWADKSEEKTSPLTVRNATDSDTVADSDSDAESEGSDWSSFSSESDTDTGTVETKVKG